MTGFDGREPLEASGTFEEKNFKRWTPYTGLPWFQKWMPKPNPDSINATPSQDSPINSCGFKLIMGTVGGKLVQRLSVVRQYRFVS